jgi:hypothetical protein
LFIWGEEGDTGNSAWLRFGGIGVQPAEIVKIAYIIIQGRLMIVLQEREGINKPRSVIALVAVFAVVFGLIIVSSSDLGSALVYFFVFAVMLFAGGLSLWWFLGGIAAIGAVIPFLLHNAFGIESKMFVGDGGSLQMGVVLSVFVMEVVCKPEYGALAEAENLALVPFVLATLSIPVFDTLRVMSARIARGISPLIGDKTHLHHLFIGLGISHIGTAVLITLLNLCVVLAWHAAARNGCSADAQLYVVIGTALLLDWGIYYLVALLDKTIPERMNRLREWKMNHRPSRRLFDFMRKIVDKM